MFLFLFFGLKGVFLFFLFYTNLLQRYMRLFVTSESRRRWKDLILGSG